jgi:hypothetical protein
MTDRGPNFCFGAQQPKLLIGKSGNKVTTPAENVSFSFLPLIAADWGEARVT